MNRFPSRQNGLTLISLLIVLGLIAFFTLLLLKIGPIYLEHHKVKQALSAMEEDESLTTSSKRQIMSLLMKKLDINMVDDVAREDINIVKQGQHVKVNVSYEVTENILGNLDVLVYFDDEIEVGEN